MKRNRAVSISFYGLDFAAKISKVSWREAKVKLLDENEPKKKSSIKHLHILNSLLIRGISARFHFR